MGNPPPSALAYWLQWDAGPIALLLVPGQPWPLCSLSVVCVAAVSTMRLLDLPEKEALGLTVATL